MTLHCDATVRQLALDVGETQVCARGTVETFIRSAAVRRLRPKPKELFCFLSEHQSIGCAVILVAQSEHR